MFWSGVCSPMASYTVDGHVEVMVGMGVHHRLLWLEKIEIPLRRCNGQFHSTNSRTDASSPCICCIDKPVGFNRSRICYQRFDAISVQQRSEHLGLLLYLHAKFFCATKSFCVNHMRDEKTVSWTPRCSYQTVREKMGPTLLNTLRCQ